MGKSTEPRSLLDGMKTLAKHASSPYRPITDEGLFADAGKLRIPNNMRVGARIFRTGTPVSEVLAAATADYRARPEPPIEVHEAEPKAFSWVSYIHDTYIAPNSEPGRPGSVKPVLQTAITDLFEAFLVTSLAQVAEDDRELFERRLKERLS